MAWHDNDSKIACIYTFNNKSGVTLICHFVSLQYLIFNLFITIFVKIPSNSMIMLYIKKKINKKNIIALISLTDNISCLAL